MRMVSSCQFSGIEDDEPGWLQRACLLQLKIATPTAGFRHTNLPKRKNVQPYAWFRHVYVGLP